MNLDILRNFTLVAFILSGATAFAAVRYVQDIGVDKKVHCYLEDPNNLGFALPGSMPVDQGYFTHCYSQDIDDLNSGSPLRTYRNIHYVMGLGIDGKQYCYLADRSNPMQPLAGSFPVDTGYPTHCMGRKLKYSN